MLKGYMGIKRLGAPNLILIQNENACVQVLNRKTSDKGSRKSTRKCNKIVRVNRKLMDSFHNRYNEHTCSFTSKGHKHQTKLLELIWELKEKISCSFQ